LVSTTITRMDSATTRWIEYTRVRKKIVPCIVMKTRNGKKMIDYAIRDATISSF